MITTGDRGGVQNSLKSDDVYVNDPLLYYTGKKKSFINSLWKIRYAHEALYLHIAFQEWNLSTMHRFLSLLNEGGLLSLINDKHFLD